MDIEELFQNAMQFRHIKNAALAKDLLEYLYENRERVTPALEIAEVVLADHRPGEAERRVRERVYDLRKRLEDFDKVFESDSRLDLPDATVGPYGGYRLRCVRKDPLSPAKVFWGPHSASDNVQFLYAEPVFFFDPKKVSYIRYYDVNPRVQKRELAVEELEKAHGPELKRLLGEEVKERLSPRHVYIGLGEMEAMDLLGDWFRRESFLTTRRKSSGKTVSLQDEGGCPVVLGNARSNHLIDFAFDSRDGKRFAYRQHQNRNGFISILSPTPDETEALSDFRNNEEAGGHVTFGLPADLSPTRDRLALVHRLRVPGGDGFATIISSDYTFGIRQVAFALTNDKQATEIMRKAAWRDQRIPQTFEMIFKIPSAPMYFEHNADKAELLCWRPR